MAERWSRNGRPGDRRVVVTGMGVFSPLGNTVDAHWRGLVAGRSGIGPITQFDPSGYPTRIAGEVRDFDPRDYVDGKEAKRMARFSQLAVAAARVALAQSGLRIEPANQEDVGVYMGTGVGGFSTLEQECRALVAKGGSKISPFFVPMFLPNMAAAHTSRIFGAKGYNATVITACAAGTQAIGEGADVIRRGLAKAMIVGGTEAGLCELGLAGFCIMRAMSGRNEEPTKASRPFDAGRDGFVPAEGAGVLILEDLEHALGRRVPILAEILGYGASNDGFHIVMPDPEGEGPARAIRFALKDAGLRPEEIGYINAHGTATPLNDAAETKAIKKAFGDYAYKVPISSSKSMVGHMLGGAGAAEAITCIMSLREGMIHPTINQETPDPECDLDYVPNVARRADIRYAMSNSFGFGGQNACLICARYED
ncbi:MAG: beta-ketoacyl-ACP synthase II [Chloroflexi bacterium]|nr:beta-ketoacyl-ACP synthase II [Chloroflexota bacterium]MCL5108392.1 beta-ketoacyl-ACP synthase II [Chloroflexota bacterium]